MHKDTEINDDEAYNRALYILHMLYSDFRSSMILHSVRPVPALSADDAVKCREDVEMSGCCMGV